MTNENEVAVVTNNGIQSVKDLTGNVQIVQLAMKEVMKQGCHFDIIPGCGKKKVLLKPGSEVLLSMFRIGVEPVVEDLGNEFEHRYRVKSRGFHIPTGNTIGYGVGECSTSEKKYAWRAAVCDEEFDETIETHRQKYWSIDYKTKKPVCVKQVRQNPADLANTVLKMAKKRAQIDLCLTATACSDIFYQDLDEEHIRESAQNNGGNSFKKPEAKKQAPQDNNSSFVQQEGCISEGQYKRLYAKIKSQDKYTEENVQAWVNTNYSFGAFESIKWQSYEEICNHIDNGTFQ